MELDFAPLVYDMLELLIRQMEFLKPWFGIYILSYDPISLNNYLYKVSKIFNDQL